MRRQFAAQLTPSLFQKAIGVGLAGGNRAGDFIHRHALHVQFHDCAKRLLQIFDGGVDVQLGVRPRLLIGRDQKQRMVEVDETEAPQTPGGLPAVVRDDRSQPAGKRTFRPRYVVIQIGQALQLPSQ